MGRLAQGMLAVGGWRAVVAAVMALAGAVPLAAQDDAPRRSPNPYQEDVAFELGRELAVNVEVEGVLWAAVRVSVPEGEQPAPGVDSTALVSLRFENRSKRGVDLVVVVLLEDESGARLQRLACPEVHLGGGKTRDFLHSFTAPGADLLAARRVYLFLQVQ
ncbi:MAG TPA: hypothetical protein PKJ99_00155 [Thermoanaerobaculales bacterium]|nr:hypothetical protein [Thermoanaerobaculales bacterium]HQL29730.1 hypothetical protein [Thermoanaerobaculales bacterium]